MVFREGFCPYIKIPVRYILAANFMLAQVLRANKLILKTTCHQSVCKSIKGKRAVNTIGELNGIILAQKLKAEFGLFITL